jgi:hypothetical protein
MKIYVFNYTEINIQRGINHRWSYETIMGMFCLLEITGLYSPKPTRTETHNPKKSFQPKKQISMHL